MNYFRRHWKRIVLIIVLLPFVLLLLVSILLYTPFVQQWAVKYASEKISEASGMIFKAEELHLDFPANIRLNGVSMLRSPKDTLAMVQELKLRIDPLPLLKNRASVPMLRLQGAYVNLPDSTGLNEMKIRINDLKASDIFANLDDHTADLGTWDLDGGSFMMRHLNPEKKPDEEKSENNIDWKLRMQRLGIKNLATLIDMPLDSLIVDAYVGWGQITKPMVDLNTILVTAKRLELKESRVKYARDHGPAVKETMDYTHIVVDPVALDVKDIKSQLANLDLEVVDFKAKDRCGLEVKGLSGVYHMDSLGIKIADLNLRTAKSELVARQADLPWGIFSKDTTAVVSVDLDASLDLTDLHNLAEVSVDNVLEQIKDGSLVHRTDSEQLPPLELQVNAQGTLNEMNVEALRLFWPTVLDADVKGRAVYLIDEKRRSGRFNLEVGFQSRASSLLSFAGKEVTHKFHIPSGMTVKGDLDLNREQLKADVKVRDGNGTLDLIGNYSTNYQGYQVNLDVNGMNVRRFMPADSIGMVSLNLQGHGRGFDVFDTRSTADLKLKVDRLDYGKLSLDSITADAKLQKGALYVALNSENRGIDLAAQVDLLLNRKHVDGSVMLDLQHLDLAALGFISSPLTIQSQLTVEVKSDMKESHMIKANILSTRLKMNNEELSPKQMLVYAQTSPDSMVLSALSGDLKVDFLSAMGLNKFLAQVKKTSEKITHTIAGITSEKGLEGSMNDLIATLPDASLDLKVGCDNAIWPYLRLKRISFDRVESHLEVSPNSGVKGRIELNNLTLDTMRISQGLLTLDTRRRTTQPDSVLGVGATDEAVLDIHAMINRPCYRNQTQLNAMADASLTLNDVHAKVTMFDEKKMAMHNVGLDGSWRNNVYRLHIDPNENLVVGYAPFAVNADNYVTYNKLNKQITANLRMTNEEGALISMLSDDTKTNANELELIVQRFDLNVLSKWRIVPPVKGVVFADVKYSQPLDGKTEPVVTGDLSVNNLVYAEKALGFLGVALFYEPRNDNSHYITAEINHNERPAISLNGIYKHTANEEALSGNLSLDSLDMAIANPFIGKDLASLSGTANGIITLGGTFKDISIDGQLYFADAIVDVKQYGSRLRLDKKPIVIKDSKLFFDHYAISPANKTNQAVYVDGTFAFLGEQALTTNLKISADEVELVNTPLKHDKQALYGRLMASADLSITGKANKPKIRGSLGVLGGTNVTYVLQGQNLNTADKMSDVVKFVDFRDTLFTAEPVTTTELGGLDINVLLHIDPAVIANVKMGATDDISVTGGGDLNFSYPPYGEMSLTGTYNVGGGKLKYNVAPVIGVKEFTLAPSSYIQFNGKPDNPYLNFTANYKQKANVSDGGKEASRRVDFIVSIKAQDYLDKLKLSFDIDAPSDLMVRNILSGMNAEERGKQAIALMATGTFLASQGSSGGGLNFNGALSGILQSSLNSLFGKVLEGTSLNLGMEMHDGANGMPEYTDYTYSFSRSFYNDRVRAIIGGKVQTGNIPGNKEQTLIDNAALEYQIDKSGSQYFKIFHHRIYDNIFEGEISETGLSYIIRRKLERLVDLFRFKKERIPQPLDPDMEKDSVATEPAKQEFKKEADETKNK